MPRTTPPPTLGYYLFLAVLLAIAVTTTFKCDTSSSISNNGFDNN